MSAPIIRLDSWPALRRHPAPGTVYAAMAAPRAWELGAGRVPALAPDLGALREVKAGRMLAADYFRLFGAALAQRAEALQPGALVARLPDGALAPIVDGDTLCCSCARGVQLGLVPQMTCHLEVAAVELRRAGWKVSLWGGAPC